MWCVVFAVREAATTAAGTPAELRLREPAAPNSLLKEFCLGYGGGKKTAGHHGTFHDTFWYTHHNQRMNTFEVPVCQSVESRFTSDPGVQPLWAMTFFFLNDIFLYLCQVHICGGVAYGMHTLLWAKSFKIYIFTVINSCGGVAYGVHRYRYRTRREWEDGVHPSAGDVKSWHDCT